MKPFGILINNFEGMNLTDDDNKIQPNEARELLNIDPYLFGYLRRRKGMTSFILCAAGGSAYIENMIRFYPDASTKMLITAIHSDNNTYLYKVLDDESGAIITGGSGFRYNTKPRFAVYNGKLFVSDGYNPIQYTEDGITLTDCSGNPSPPRPKYICIHKERLYGAGGPNDPSSLYRTDVGVYDNLPGLDFPADNVEPIGNITSPIVGIIPQQDHIVIFKEDTFHKWIGTQDYEFRVLDSNRSFGLLAPDTMIICDGWVVFLASDYTIKAYDGGLNCQTISNKIKIILNGTDRRFGANPTHISGSTSVYHNGLYRLFYQGFGSPYRNLELVFNFRKYLESGGKSEAWFLNKGRNINCGSVYSGSQDQNELKFGGSSSAMIYNGEIGWDDDGTVIDMYWRSKKLAQFEGASNHDIKKFRKLKMDAYLPLNGQLDITYDVDDKRVGNKSNVAGSINHHWSTNTAHRWGTTTGTDTTSHKYWDDDITRDFNLGFPDAAVGKYLELMIRENTVKDDVRINDIMITGKAKPFK